jgi:hypothetical protein
MPRRRLGLASLVATLALVAAPLRGEAQVVELLDLIAAEGSDGWRLEIDLEGTGISSVFIHRGPLPMLQLTCMPSAGFVDCQYDDPPPTQPGYPSLAALLAVHVPGTWGLLVDGVLSASFAFGPVEPNGTVTVTAPASGATDVSPTPTIDYTHDCSNCNVLAFEIEDFDGTLGIGLETFLFGPPLPSPGSVPYAILESFEGPKPPALPNGRYELFASTAVGAITVVPFDQGGSFEYTTGAIRDRRTVFTVPEPASATSAAVAALAAVCCARRSRARARRRTP